jgi:hypothetical protein
MTPFRVEGTAGADVTVNMTIADVTDLYLFQMGLRFNPNTVNCTGVFEGGFLSNNGADQLLPFSGEIDNTAGIVGTYAWSLLNPAQAKNGGGVLVRFTFHMKTTGYSDVHIRDLLLLHSDGVEMIPIRTIDYFTAVVDSGTFIVRIEGNAQTGAGVPGGYSAHNVTKVDRVIGPDTYHGLLSFNVTGSDVNLDLFAFFNVTIPKSMMNCTTSGQWFVSLNGVQQGTRTIFENATHTTISLEFTYDDFQPTGTVEILSINIVPEFSAVFLATLLVLATFAAALFGKATWSYKRKS